MSALPIKSQIQSGSTVTSARGGTRCPIKRRKGVLKEIFPNICKFLRLYYGILRIELGVSNNNKIAIISYKKIGFKKLKLREARLIKKLKNMNIYVFNIL